MFDFVATGGRPFVFPLAGLGDGQMLECSGNFDGVDVVQSCIYGNKKSLLTNDNQIGYYGCCSAQFRRWIEPVTNLYLFSLDVKPKLKQTKQQQQQTFWKKTENLDNSTHLQCMNNKWNYITPKEFKFKILPSFSLTCSLKPWPEMKGRRYLFTLIHSPSFVLVSSLVWFLP